MGSQGYWLRGTSRSNHNMGWTYSHLQMGFCNTDVDFKNLSIREINAQGGPAASGTVAGAFTSGGEGEQLMTTEQEEKEEAIDRNQKIATSGDYVYVV
jgi:hypothetical protein